MSRTCMVTGKAVMSGNNRSHAENKTHRKFLPNVQNTSVYSEALGRKVSVKVSAAGLRTLDHKGGIDAFVTGTAKTKLDPALRKVKAQVEKALAKKA
ncbi:MAG: 50S ribosomal protein L28 [Rhodospirillales bacterium]|nr:50S ribosomal protein L28 [Alphaproteobacteria bacterium]USO03428.1 MAG: 50S ribosomal protein L28 [Rhodospirillales bacterium]